MFSQDADKEAKLREKKQKEKEEKERKEREKRELEEKKKAEKAAKAALAAGAAAGAAVNGKYPQDEVSKEAILLTSLKILSRQWRAEWFQQVWQVLRQTCKYPIWLSPT